MSKYRRRKVSVLLGISVFVIGLSVFRNQQPSFEGKPLRVWLDDLTTADDEGRELAKEAILAMGPETIPFLLQSIRSIDSPMRRMAMEWLSQQSLIKVDFKAWENQIHGSMIAFHALGPMASPALPKLIRLLPRQTWLAASFIASIGPAVRSEPVAFEAIPVLIEALKDSDPDTRDAVQGALAAIGEEAVIPLTAAMKSSDSTVRKHATDILGTIGRMENRVVPSLTAALADGDSNVRRAAAKALALFGPSAKDSVPALVILLGDESLDVRVNAAGALERIAPGKTEALNLLVELLENEQIRVEAAAAIGSIGARAKQAVPGLIGTFAASSARVGEAKARQGDPIKPGTSEFRSLNQLLWPEDYFRANVAIALGKVGSAAVPAVPILAEALSDDADWVRSHAASALGKIGPSAKSALPELIAAMKDSDQNVRKNSADALGEIDPEDGSVITILIQALNDEETDVRVNAVNGLAKVRSKRTAVIEAMSRAVQDPKHKVRLAAIAAIRRLGADAATVSETLRHAAGDRFPSVRKAALAGLRDIEMQTSK